MSYYRFVVGEADATVTGDLAGHPAEDLDGDWTVTYLARSVDGTLAIGPLDGIVTDPTVWVVQVTFTADALDTAGRFRGRFRAEHTDGRVAKFPGDLIDIIHDRAETPA